jgi:hypothetical protein
MLWYNGVCYNSFLVFIDKLFVHWYYCYVFYNYFFVFLHVHIEFNYDYNGHYYVNVVQLYEYNLHNNYYHFIFNILHGHCFKHEHELDDCFNNRHLAFNLH